MQGSAGTCHAATSSARKSGLNGTQEKTATESGARRSAEAVLIATPNAIPLQVWKQWNLLQPQEARMTYPQFKRQFQKLVQPCSLCCQDVLLPTAAGEPVVMLVANLPKLLRHVVAESPAYKTALLAGLQQDHVLKPVLYHDEAQGGNLLAHVKKKKATLFYICFQQLANAFHLEQAWLPVAFLTHEECDKVDGKLSTATARALRHLWQPCAGGCSIEGLSCDIAVQLHSTCLMLCDFDAQRACTGTVGSAGMVCCAFCSNVLKKNSGISDSNFVEYHEWDRRKFLARSAGDYKDAADKLRLLNKKKRHPSIRKEQWPQTSASWPHVRQCCKRHSTHHQLLRRFHARVLSDTRECFRGSWDCSGPDSCRKRRTSD